MLCTQIVMVERLKTAVLATEKRKLMYGAKRRAEDYAHEASFSEVVKSALSKHAQWRWTAGMGNDSADDLLRTLHALQPEAQVGYLQSSCSHASKPTSIITI